MPKSVSLLIPLFLLQRNVCNVYVLFFHRYHSIWRDNGSASANEWIYYNNFNMTTCLIYVDAHVDFSPWFVNIYIY